MKIPVTREFNKLDPIGFLTLRDDIEILPGAEFALGYIILARASDGTPTKIQVQEVSLIIPPVKRGETNE